MIYHVTHFVCPNAVVGITIAPVSNEVRNNILSVSVASLQEKGVGQAQYGFSMHRFQCKEMSFTQSDYMEVRREIS